VQVDGTHCPTGSAHKHILPAPQSASVVHPYWHWHREKNPEVDISQWPSGNAGQSASEVHPGPASLFDAQVVERGSRLGQVTIARRLKNPAAHRS
jgi:hypothetical protein